MSYSTTMHRSQLPRSGMALGGIGTGGFEIRQDGGFFHWSIYNNWPLFTGARYPHNEKQSLFFMLWVKAENENPRLVLLQIEDGHDTAAIEGHEFQYIFPWISGVDTIHYKASVPFADLDFEQEGLPLAVSLRAWSPLIPGNVKDSALPLAYFDFEIRSKSERPVDVQILAVARNAVGYDQPGRIYVNRRVRDGDFSAVVMENGQLDPEAQTTGTVCLASFDKSTSAYSGWEHHHPYYERLLREFPMPEVDDTAGRNRTDASTGKMKADPRCFVTLARAAHLPARGSNFRHTFACAWHFPNLFGRPMSNDPNYGMDDPNGHDRPEGHAYTNYFDSAEAVARYAQAHHARLRGETEAFHRTFFDSSLPQFVLDQVNSHLNTFRTSTWLTRTGMYGVLEGLSHTKPYAGIGTTDVAMYGQIATSLLFPELDRLTIDIWRKFQNKENGIVVHSVLCNSYEIPEGESNGHRLDMPAQFVFQALRSALWNNDRAWLEAVWPDAKAALAYVLRERDKNGDHLPDMEGIMCSYDNFPMFGVAPFVISQWLAAVALALRVAGQLGDEEFAAEYTPFFKKGCATLESATWNGRYFQLYSDHQETDPAGESGCMVDQIIGEGMARQLGLAELIDPAKAATALRTILAMNYKPDQGLRNCQWPGDTFLHDIGKDTWVDQANTCWTGVELNFAAQLYSHGLNESAEEIIRHVDERHRKWGIYFDHQEFGGHYFRPMSALAIPNAFLGLSYDGEALNIAPARPLPIGRWCVLLPGAYGTYFQTGDGARLEIKSGKVQVKTIRLPTLGKISLSGIPGKYSSRQSESQTILTLTDQ
ncbi:MAG: GH116 family glycosyl-hydrolase [Verrucomicrobia bacterium]|nr:GH116 family glycosyl-hydrolase [Verrucomicrobiota bacterium]